MSIDSIKINNNNNGCENPLIIIEKMAVTEKRKEK
jgi:hypothetical protein